MNAEQYNKYNIVFIKNGCDRCRVLCQFIHRLNIKLPINRRIRIINCSYSQQYGIIDDPLISLFDKSFDSFPTLFIEGVKVVGVNSREEIETYLYTYFHNYFIVTEDNPFMFNKDCEIKQKGIFKGKIICN